MRRDKSDEYKPKTSEEINKWEQEIIKRDKEYLKELNKPVDEEELKKTTLVVPDENE